MIAEGETKRTIRKTTAMLLAGGINLGFSVLTHNRAKSAMPICGHLRIIDFMLSNLSRSGIDSVGVLIQYLPGSLIDHVGVGRPWDLDSSNRHIKLMPPFVGMGKTKWFRGSADAIYQNLDFIRDNKAEQVLVLSADHLYGMDYSAMIESHRRHNADLTILTTPLPEGVNADMFGCVEYGEDDRIVRFVEKPPSPVTNTISTGVYLFRAETLIDALEALREDTEVSHNLPTSVVEPLVSQGRVYGHAFEGEWAYLPDLESYVDYHRRLILGRPTVDPNAIEVRTNLRDRELGSRPSPYFGRMSTVRDSLISPGCQIEGTVVRSVLSPGVRVEPGALVRDSILFHDCHVEEGAQLLGVVSDKDASYGPYSRTGAMDEDPERFDYQRITVVGKGAQILPGVEVGPGLEIPIDQYVSSEWLERRHESLSMA